jgi:hypothetical protein
MADPQPDNKNLLWAMIAGAVVLLLVIYIFAGADRPPAPPAAPPAVNAPVAPTESPAPTVPEAPPPP